MNDVPFFIMQGVEQCWHCKHRDGSGVHHVNGYWYRLPYCKVCDADMTIIYEPPCREFEAEDDTDFYTKGHLHLGYVEEGE